MLTRFLFVSISFFFYYTTTCYAQTQPRTVASGLRPHLSKTGLRPGPYLKQLESAEPIDSFGEIGCGGYLARHSSCYFFYDIYIARTPSVLHSLLRILLNESLKRRPSHDQLHRILVNRNQRASISRTIF